MAAGVTEGAGSALGGSKDFLGLKRERMPIYTPHNAYRRQKLNIRTAMVDDI